MALDYKVLSRVKGNPSTEVAPGRRLKLNPGQDYAYDMPKELIAVIGERFNAQAHGVGASKNEEALIDKGQEFMRYLITQADSEAFRDRTGEMIELVAEQTGIRFPHSFERYVELGILSLRPRDAWAVTAATTKTLQIRSYNCTLNKLIAQQAQGDCQDFCFAACQVAADKVGVNLNMARTKQLGADGVCELTFTVRQG